MRRSSEMTETRKQSSGGHKQAKVLHMPKKYITFLSLRSYGLIATHSTPNAVHSCSMPERSSSHAYCTLLVQTDTYTHICPCEQRMHSARDVEQMKYHLRTQVEQPGMQLTG